MRHFELSPRFIHKTQLQCFLKVHLGGRYHEFRKTRKIRHVSKRFGEKVFSDYSLFTDLFTCILVLGSEHYSYKIFKYENRQQLVPSKLQGHRQDNFNTREWEVGKPNVRVCNIACVHQTLPTSFTCYQRGTHGTVVKKIQISKRLGGHSNFRPWKNNSE